MTQSPVNWMPTTGYDTQNPIIVLDFKSLYPSILIARNMCFSTQVVSGTQIDSSIRCWTGFSGTKFVSREVKDGIVPEILRHFLNERQKVKALMRSTQDKDLKTVLDGRQKALKVVANAVYGFTGARESKLQSLPIAESTITEGAKLLESAKLEIERRYNTPTQKVEVVYGDTDSVFVKVYGLSVPDAISLGRRMAKDISALYTDPISLEFEKVLFPSLLINRKRYAGLLWTQPEKPDGIDIKGIEANRRDAVPIISEIINEILALLFPHILNTPDSLIAPSTRSEIIGNVKTVTGQWIKKVAGGNVDIGSLIMTKGLWLGTDAESYKTTQPHIRTLEKIKSRDPRRTFKDGERISYVFVKGPPAAKGFEKVEDPAWVLEHGGSLDYSYYIDHTLVNPLTRILELLVPHGEIQTLFNVPRTKLNLFKAGHTTTSPSKIGPGGGIMSAFLKSGQKTLSICSICSAKTAAPGRKLCLVHEHQASTLLASKKSRLTRTQTARDAIHATCKECQGCDERKILCINFDCNVFFRRKGLDAEVLEVQEELDEFTAAEKGALSW